MCQKSSGFFFNDPATPEIYTLSLRDALPICHHRHGVQQGGARHAAPGGFVVGGRRAGGHGNDGLTASGGPRRDRKSTRLNSSHANISYAVFCLKKNTSTLQALTTTLLQFVYH